MLDGPPPRDSDGNAARGGRDRRCAGRRGLRLAAAVVVAAATALAPTTAPASEPPDRATPILLSADRADYDQERDLIRAVGNVEVSQADRVLKADEIVYDQRSDRLTALGHVVLLEPTGERVFASRMEITGDLKSGIIDDLRLVFADGARLAAAGGSRRDGTVTDMAKAVYSPCALCTDEPTRPPLWQVKAVRVRHDQTEKIVEFTDAWMELDGVPVFYLPYFYQPDPTVKRKTGLLVPTFANSSDFGLVAQIPFYWAISPQQDLTLTPWFTTKENAVLEAEYRAALKHGAVEFDGSVTRDSRERWRGHVFGTARYDIDDVWRAGLDVRRTNDRTYLRRYDFSDQDTLTSRLFGEAFIDRSDYFVANSYLFQGLRSGDDNDSIPIVAPKLDYFHVGEVDALGGRSDVHLGAAAFTRQDGADTRRMSARAGWERPVVGTLGELYTFSAALWGDLYNVNNLRRDGRDDRFTGTDGRLFPQVGVEWRLPLVRDGEAVQQIVEPIVEAIYAPDFGNSSRIPNEDSENFEFDHLNVFGFQRFPGLDRVEEGPRMNYGVAWNLYGRGGARTTLFAGQTYRFFEDSEFPRGSGMEGHFSDVVAAVDLAPVDYLDLTYRNRLDAEDLAVRRHELGALIGSRTLKLGATYINFDQEDEFRGREELGFVLTSQLTRYWRTRLSGVRDLTGGGAQRDLGIRFTYEDECFLFTVGYARDDIEDRDIEPSDVVFVRFGFKTIGDIGGGLRRRGGG
jgi:LPS-assembly protein